MLRHSTSIRIAGRRLQGETTYELCVIAIKNIKQDEYIWELCGVYSIKEGPSDIEPGVQWLVGPARLCHHKCSGNSVFVCFPDRPGAVLRATQDIKAGQEITASYRFHKCRCETCTETPMEYLGTSTTSGPDPQVL